MYRAAIVHRALELSCRNSCERLKQRGDFPQSIKGINIAARSRNRSTKCSTVVSFLPSWREECALNKVLIKSENYGEIAKNARRVAGESRGEAGGRCEKNSRKNRTSYSLASSSSPKYFTFDVLFVSRSVEYFSSLSVLNIESSFLFIVHIHTHTCVYICVHVLA